MDARRKERPCGSPRSHTVHDGRRSHTTTLYVATPGLDKAAPTRTTLGDGIVRMVARFSSPKTDACPGPFRA